MMDVPDSEYRAQYGTELVGLLYGHEQLRPSPEWNLAAQMLALTVNDARTRVPPPRGRGATQAPRIIELRQAAVEWLLDDPDGDVTAPTGSFQWVCRALDLDPTWARERIMKNLRAEGFYPIPTLGEVYEDGYDSRARNVKPIRTHHKAAYHRDPEPDQVLGFA